MKVGDYIRTDEGIRKIIREYDIYYELDRSLHYMYPEGHDLNKEDVDDIVLKSSPNIIDLIKIGDYVNGNPVCLIKEDEHNRKWIYTDSNYKCGYLEEDIATILTHEQFEKMMYKIGDE